MIGSPPAVVHRGLIFALAAQQSIIPDCGNIDSSSLTSASLRPRGRSAAEQRDELAAFHVDFVLLFASPATACHPASLIFIRATSIILPSATTRSACADASPAPHQLEQQLGRKSVR